MSDFDITYWKFAIAGKKMNTYSIFDKFNKICHRWKKKKKDYPLKFTIAKRFAISGKKNKMNTYSIFNKFNIICLRWKKKMNMYSIFDKFNNICHRWKKKKRLPTQIHNCQKMNTSWSELIKKQPTNLMELLFGNGSIN